MTTTGGPVTDDELERFCADAYPKLVGALAHHFRGRWLAEELAQEAMVRVCDRWTRVVACPRRWAGLPRGHETGPFTDAAASRRTARALSARVDRAVQRDADTADRLAV